MIGWIQRAFVLSFYYLLRHNSYQTVGIEAQFFEDSIYQTIQEGGDTDTNACIVGGMLGALLGLKALPQKMVSKILEFDCTDFYKSYPNENFVFRNFDKLSVKKHCLKNIQKLVEIRPIGKVKIIK